MVILGTQYAGEMKKGIFSVMHYLMPKRGILSLHSGCNVGANEDVSLFFGLSGAPLAPSLCALVQHIYALYPGPRYVVWAVLRRRPAHAPQGLAGEKLRGEEV